jgi:hypothetical protein
LQKENRKKDRRPKSGDRKRFREKIFNIKWEQKAVNWVSGFFCV